MKVFWLMILVLGAITAVVAWNHAAPKPSAPDVNFPPETSAAPIEPSAEQPVAEVKPEDDAASLAIELTQAADAREELPPPLIAQTSSDSSANPAAAVPAVPEAQVIDAEPIVHDSLDQFPLDKTVPVKVARLDDGALMLDDRFVVRGSGTAEDPYRISWDLLVSAGEEYAPRLGKMKLPQRVTLLHNKHVRITGNLAFPPIGGEIKDLLIMLNQWDGCCIGVPPSPYDAIEVKLATPMTIERQHASPFATVEGVLTVDPYLMDTWLVGLYLMKEGAVKLEM